MLLVLVLAGCEAAADGGGPASGAGGAGDRESPMATDSGGEASPTSIDMEQSFGGNRPTFPRPDSVRALYVNPEAARSPERLDSLLDLARRTEINAFVLDVKAETGFVTHASRVPLAREVGAVDEARTLDLPTLLDRLESEGVYPIGRIVIVKDSVLGRARPELAVQDTAGGVWADSRNLVWLNLHQRPVWDYVIDLAVEAARMGIPEIQWDYVRFPDAGGEDMARARFPGDSAETRTEAVRGFMQQARRRLDALGLGVRMTADVFGATATFGRVASIGQEWDRFIDLLDAAHPMVYPSHYWEGSYGMEEPNARPYEIVRSALEDARRRNEGLEGAGDVRPWLQDFTQGAPRYEAPYVRAQIQATYDAGFTGWMLWNRESRYSAAALQPVTGFPREPRIRVAGELVPVSGRDAALERGAARRQARADSLERARADSLAPGTDGLAGPG